MNVLLVSIDSLRRDVLSTYRDRPAPMDYAVDTPNLDHFAEKACVFDTHYAGSLPCMPARREWFAGIQEFLWRPWGPLEPFDQELPVLLRESDTLTKLITDHYHYFQYGSNGYYEAFNGFDFVRGHEYDAWRTTPRYPDEAVMNKLLDKRTDHPDSVQFVNRVQYPRNAAELDGEEEFFAPQVFSKTADWIDENDEWDEWFLYVDSFDIHEPFHVPEPYASRYTEEDPDDPDLPVWPYYGRIDEGQSHLTDRQLAFVQSQYAGKATMVDRWFGRVLDTLDAGDLWDETMVILTSDHGFCLGDHGWVGKNHSPMYDALANTPLFVWHPGAERNGERVDALTSAVDLYATILDAMDVPVLDHVHSRSLLPLLMADTDTHRRWALYGYWGTSVNVTDGEYTYLHPCDPDVPTYCYSTTMMNADAMGSFVPRTAKDDATADTSLPYTDAPVWQFSGKSHQQNERPLLFDTDVDPGQERNIAGEDTELTARMRTMLVDAMESLGAPAQQYERLGLDQFR